MNVIGLIPARGGSKGILHKNLTPLAGKPLLAYTCEAARQSHALCRTIVSTDDEAIAHVARTYGMDVPFMRPKDLAQDTTPMLSVLQHALAAMAQEGSTPDAIALLQPTSPLRSASHIDQAVGLFEATGADTVVSVCTVPHRFNPSSIMMEENGRLLPYEGGTQILRRQDKPRLYARNGPAILIIRRATIELGNLYGSDVRPFIMDRRSSLDIDDAEDLGYAEFLLQLS